MWKVSHLNCQSGSTRGKSSLNAIFFRYVQINLLRVKRRYSFECQVVQYVHISKRVNESNNFTISCKLKLKRQDRSRSIRRNVVIHTCRTFDYFQTYQLCMGAFHRSACWTWFDRGYHYHSNKLQISTDVKKERGRSVDQAWFLYSWRPYLEILECDWLNDVDEWGEYYKTGKQPRSKIYIDLPVCNNLWQDFLFTRMTLLLNGFQ